MAFVYYACAAARKNDALPLPLLIGESAQLDRSSAENWLQEVLFLQPVFLKRGMQHVTDSASSPDLPL